MAFAQLQDAEGLNTGAGRKKQNVVRDGKRAQTLENAQNTITGGRSKTPPCQSVKPDFYGSPLNGFQRATAERGQDMLPQDAFVNLPAPLAQTDVRQVYV